MKWKGYILFFFLLFGSLLSYSQYNAYALDLLSDDEQLRLSEVVPEGTVLRIGGEEYENKEYSPLKFIPFIEAIKGYVVLVASSDWEHFLGVYEAFGSLASDEVTYKNEQWFELENWNNIRRDLWTYLTNKQKYYRKHASKHLFEARQFQEFMHSKGHDIELVINVPLPQNKFYRAYLDEVGTAGINKVDIHVYGKWYEGNYFTKLDSQLETVLSYDWDVFVGEYNALFNHKKGRELKNSNTDKEMHEAIISTLHSFGIYEIYSFTLCANSRMVNEWQNPPIYHRWEVLIDTVLDTKNNVFK